MKNRKLLVYPLLIGLYPAISLLANNATEIQLSDGFRSIGISLILSGLVYLVCKLLVKNNRKAALLAAMVLILFFTYGHLYLFLDENSIFGRNLARIRYLVPLYAVIFGAGSFLIVRTKKDLAAITQGVAAASLIVLLFPVFQIGGYLIRSSQVSNQGWASSESEILLNLSPVETAPDVYYIILDGYARADMLEALGYDNSGFLQQLEDLGFFVAECSQANYSWTLPSVTSTLNLQYLDNGQQPNQINIDEDRLYTMLDHNLARAAFENLGYSIASFENGFEWLHWYDADKYYAAVGDEEGQLRLNMGMNGFELLFLETSLARLVIDTNLLSPKDQSNPMLSNPREIHRQRVTFAIDTLPEVSAELSSPIFVYAHIVSPHSPYIFGPNGEWLTADPEDTNQAYLDQLSYLNGQILETVQAIIQDAARPTVIILQGDHGAPVNWPEGEEEFKLGILNAFYFSDGPSGESLYTSISPVNTFRLIFNHYFNAGLDLLPDRSILGPSSPFIELPCN